MSIRKAKKNKKIKACKQGAVACQNKADNLLSIKLLGAYTLFWALGTCFLLFIFAEEGKTLIWSQDGITQHYTAFNLLIQFISTLIADPNSATFMNLSLGQGADLLTTLSAYDFADPISWLCACLTPLPVLFRYSLMICIKLYLVGLAFLIFCAQSTCTNKTAALSGAIAYTFSAGILFTLARHPNYISAAYFFAFILAGIERADRKNQYLLFIGSVCFNALTSFYTLYVNVILILIYSLIKYLCRFIKKKDTLRHGLCALAKLCGAALLGLGLASVVLLPCAYAYSINPRTAGAGLGNVLSPFVYNNTFFLDFLKELFGTDGANFYTNLGANALGFVAISLLFILRKKSSLTLKCLLIISAVICCLPCCGSMLNGFSYATNRWSYALIFYVSVCIVVNFAHIKQCSRKQIYIVAALVPVYAALCLINVETNTLTKAYELAVIATVVLAVVLLVRLRPVHFDAFLYGITFCASLALIFSLFNPALTGYIDEFDTEADLESSLCNSSILTTQNATEGTSFYRSQATDAATNSEWVDGVWGTSYYWSLLDASIGRYYTTLGLSSIVNNCHFQNLDQRVGLLGLAGVKYYSTLASENTAVPYGFVETGKSLPEAQDISAKEINDAYIRYENKNALPLGYTYTSALDYKEYETLNALEKEQALMQSAVVDDAEATGLVQGTEAYAEQSLDYYLSSANNASFDTNSLLCAENGGSICLETQIPDNCEIYLYIDTPELDGLDVDEDGAMDTLLTNIKVTRQHKTYRLSKKSVITNQRYSWPIKRDALAFDLGYGEAGKNKIKITLDRACAISFKSIAIMACSCSVFDNALQARAQYTMTDACISGNTVTGTISTPDRRFLQFCLPYSTGWSAYVDGVKVQLTQSSVMYMGVTIDPGQHEITLKYETPYFKEGLIISGLAVLVLIVYVAMRIQRNLARREQEHGV